MYAITDDEGALVDVVESDDPRVAEHRAWQMGPSQVIYDDSYNFLQTHEKAAVGGTPQPSTRDLDNLRPQRAPAAAWHAGGRLKITRGDLEDIGLGRDGLEEAHRLLFPFFADLRLTATGKFPAPWRKPGTMAAHLLRQNYKTSKTHPTGPTNVQGLSLLPKKFWSKKLDGAHWLEQMGLTKTRGRSVDFCIAASEWCEQACLVYSGRQMVDVYNTALKEATVDALVAEPVAFGRMLWQACKSQQGNSPGLFQPKTIHDRARGITSETVPFVRLNVLSDLPWELVFPDLFEMLPSLSFYDYTKVPGRSPAPNYDLTFSFSGANFRTSLDVLEAGGKVAVVFFKRRQKGGRWPTHGYWGARVSGPVGRGRIVEAGPFPRSLFGAEVIDGDITDVRPFDRKLAQGPPPYVVGLRYKPPRGQAGGFDPMNSLFVVPCWELDGKIVTVEVPRDTPGTLHEVLERAQADVQRHLSLVGQPEPGQEAPPIVPVQRLTRRDR